jgi:HEAT repeat protein
VELDVLLALESEVARFRAWADANPDMVKDYPRDWETYYPDWRALYVAFSAFVAATSCQDWSEDIVDMLLYAIARDEDNQGLVKKVARNPDDLLFLAKQAVNSSERNLKWQIAAELGYLASHLSQAEPLLLKLASDEDEYVQRRALLALADIGSSHVEGFVDAFWNSDVEWYEYPYPRMAVLYALWKTASPRLDHYLTLAEVMASRAS